MNEFCFVSVTLEIQAKTLKDVLMRPKEDYKGGSASYILYKLK
jgi:hypothetical protein